MALEFGELEFTCDELQTIRKQGNAYTLSFHDGRVHNIDADQLPRDQRWAYQTQFTKIRHALTKEHMDVLDRHRRLGPCAAECDHGSPCVLPFGHSRPDRHETDHGCIFYDSELSND